MAEEPLEEPIIIPDKPTGPFPKLTASTSNPKGGTPDEPIYRPTLPWVYVDMRNQRWYAWWLGQGWIARPTPEAASFYGLQTGNTFDAADDARGLIDGIEAKIEARRTSSSSSGFPWWLLVVGYLMFKKGRR